MDLISTLPYIPSFIAILISYKALRSQKKGNDIEDGQLQHSIEESQRKICRDQTRRITELEKSVVKLDVVTSNIIDNLKKIDNNIQTLEKKTTDLINKLL